MKPTKSILILLSLFLMFSCETPEEPDTTPPTVTITFSESSVNEIVSITCLSTDNEGVKKVELWVNGVSTGVTDETEPYSLDWNTTTYDDGSYVITVRSYDTSDNTIDSSPITLTVDNSVSYPQSVSITSIVFGDGSFTITWNESTVSDFGSYELEKSVESTMGDYEVVYSTEIVTDTTYVDTDVDPLSYLYYRVSVIDTFSYKSKSQIVSSSLDPVPTSVNVDTVFYNLTEIKVEWEESIDGDFRDYKLLYSETESGDKDTVVTYTDKSTTSHIITSFNPTHENWYWILVSDTLGQSSIGDGMTHTIDSPPTQIDISSVTYGLTEMVVSWNKSNENDFVSYELLYSETESSEQTSITTITDVNTTSYTITDFNPLQERWYSIKVSDYWSQTTVGNGYLVLDSTPTSSELFPIEYENDSFIIKWSQNNDDDFQSYTLYESYSEDMSSSTVILETTEVDKISYIVEGVGYGKIRFYKVIVEDIWVQSSTSNTQQGNSYPKIVFTDNSGIYRMNWDGSDIRELGETYFSYNLYRQPRFYNNGTKIGYIFGSDMILMDLDGSNLINIGNIFDVSDPITVTNLLDYPLNDNLIVYIDWEKIYTMSLDGSNKTVLLDSGSLLNHNIGNPIFSHDGEKILHLYNVYSNGQWNNQLFIVNKDGSGNTQLTNNSWDVHLHQFTPDNQKIVLTKNTGGLMIMDVDGSNLTEIVGGVNGYFSISNNGNHIVFNNEENLWIIDIDGNNLNKLTNYDYHSFDYIQFSKNDEKIVYSSGNGCQDCGIYIMNIDGSEHMVLRESTGWTFIPVIQPIP